MHCIFHKISKRLIKISFLKKVTNAYYAMD